MKKSIYLFVVFVYTLLSAIVLSGCLGGDDETTANPYVECEPTLSSSDGLSSIEQSSSSVKSINEIKKDSLLELWSKMYQSCDDVEIGTVWTLNDIYADGTIEPDTLNSNYWKENEGELVKTFERCFSPFQQDSGSWPGVLLMPEEQKIWDDMRSRKSDLLKKCTIMVAIPDDEMNKRIESSHDQIKTKIAEVTSSETWGGVAKVSVDHCGNIGFFKGDDGWLETERALAFDKFEVFGAVKLRTENSPDWLRLISLNVASESQEFKVCQNHPSVEEKVMLTPRLAVDGGCSYVPRRLQFYEHSLIMEPYKEYGFDLTDPDTVTWDLIAQDYYGYEDTTKMVTIVMPKK